MRHQYILVIALVVSLTHLGCEWWDNDRDKVLNYKDNCRNIYNPDQEDFDDDGVGDLCDNCPYTMNLDQEDADNDGIGDACDECPDDASPDCSGGNCTDTDGDGSCA